MTTLTIDTDNAADIDEIKAFAKKKGWQVKQAITSSFTPSTNDDAKKKRLQEILKEGIDVSAFGDASEWQKLMRKDRELPGRNEV